ncbi:hypothetical protein BABINDRAFT_160555 [Babjeviella inositovora NRRL Y-12698]|uniref:5-oxoprolinase n=1 Tax=Babjeviella inositovora NRRL Y-12698 TaxID=984486 RepID=A0A1E3QTY8_9ASCO|nr:uncharacterized protein BABINDRAFT_160555 [Babjeviella inositovora NRRL Y-12698]ODQ81155.1 hypothetical protein BABINDRAFT_160555 [Babjeviella inositovora NRRL Y-12698]
MSGIKISIDRGGTFCDVHAVIPLLNEEYTFKLLSVDPSNYQDAPTEGIRRVLEHATGTDIPKTQKLSLLLVESIRMGTTVATNALLERKGADVALLTTKGFADILKIGTQARPNIFDLSARKLKQLYKRVVEIDERVTIESYTEGGEKPPVDITSDASLVTGITGDVIRILQAPDMAIVSQQLSELHAQGFRSLALCLLHSYAYPAHEQAIAALARQMGFQVSVSVDLQPMISMVSRTSSTVADAYLGPILQEYMQSFGAGFEGGLMALGNKLLFMQSNGGLCPWNAFSGLRAILSGPAGGMVGYAETCFDDRPGNLKATIGFDMGGTSTDVSRVFGAPEHIFETVISEVSLQTPQLDISTVAAGGGSMLFWRNGMFVVGPESAGAHPGPACYKKGGPLTVTDANLFLGRLLPEHFPNIFGPNENEPLDINATRKLFLELTETINKDHEKHLTPEEVACGFLKVAIETMCRPIRTLTESKGFATADHNLSSFGGAGGQCAVSVAKNLGIENVVIHKYSSLLSAYGMALADIVIERQQPISVAYEAPSFVSIDTTIARLKAQCMEDYQKQGLTQFSTEMEVFLNMKYVGSDTHLMMKLDGNNTDKEFIARHNQEFGFTLERKVLVDDIRVRLIVHSTAKETVNPFREFADIVSTTAEISTSQSSVYFESVGWLDSPVYQLSELAVGSQLSGPAVILDATQTILIEPHSTANILKEHVLVTVEKEAKKDISRVVVDPVQLSVFGHRFMSIAEQMGRTLQKTAISTNIKERLDFSCALFDRNGDLVANAPHVPIHLGAMSYAVKEQAQRWEGKIKHGDVFVSNHPVAGGSHLPDITVITPVLDDDCNVLFWTASRGHHADVGGIAAGSMPPDSKEIFQEGAAIITHKLCDEGVFDEEGITKRLLIDPAQYEGCSGTRTLSDNISDLKAQVAANFKGIQLLHKLVDDFSYPVIQLYMEAILHTAELSVRNLLRMAYQKFGGETMKAVDYLDDGTPIVLEIEIDQETGSAVFDFTKSGDQIYGNLNAPKAILFSAVLYVLRALISGDIPLNHGCLIPIDVRTRQGSVLQPSAEAATVGGNVETAQRCVDVILKAFQACAASQGTCNNLTFGAENSTGHGFGYYETICGGAGASATWNGQSAVQCHTTNTKITDPEVFEKRYPVILRRFEIRQGSGGKGFHTGGDGVIRDIEFTIPLQVSCLMERRALAPFGMAGGEDGERGSNFWLKKNADGSYRKIYLGGKNSVMMKPGDHVVVCTPGGGGYGKAGAERLDDGVQYPAADATQAVSRISGSVAMRTIMQETN